MCGLSEVMKAVNCRLWLSTKVKHGFFFLLDHRNIGGSKGFHKVFNNTMHVSMYI